MLNRRTFFNMLGKAVLGTAIALQIPDSIVPKLVQNYAYKLRIETLNMLYNSFRKGLRFPKRIELGNDLYEQLMIKIPIKERFMRKIEGYGEGVAYRDSIIVHNSSLRSDIILMTGGAYKNIYRHYINEDGYHITPVYYLD